MKAHVHLFRTPSTRLHLPSSVLSNFVKTGSLPLQHAFFSLFSVAQTSCNSYYSITPLVQPSARRGAQAGGQSARKGETGEACAAPNHKLGIPPGAGPTTRLLRGHERTTQTLALRNTRVREGKVKRTHEWRWETVCYLRVAKVHTHVHTHTSQRERERERDTPHSTRGTNEGRQNKHQRRPNR